MRKTIALTLICKNEVTNLPRLLKSVQGCFDKVYITDTGSDDGTLNYLYSSNDIDRHKSLAELDAGCPVEVSTFTWVNDFSKARNFAKQNIKEDYWMWMDCDDIIGNAEIFKTWKRTIMELCDVWFIPYHYAFDGDKPVISFIRERIIKTSLDATWVDPVHECIDFRNSPNAKIQGLQTWSVNHQRSAQDAENDKGRNLKILEDNKETLSLRLKFYLGKEYFDATLFDKAVPILIDVVGEPILALGDRIMALQYLTHSLCILKRFDEAIKFGSLGVQLDPTRAEFHCLVGDAYMSLNEIERAVPYYKAATGCINKSESGMNHAFAFAETYGPYPKMNLARIYYSSGNFEKAVDEIKDLYSKDAQDLIVECNKAIKATTIKNNLPKCDDIVITCPPNGAYEWDEEKYKTFGLGGSETAAVEMAKWLKKLTGRQVKIFNARESNLVAHSGVEYQRVNSVHDYFGKWIPKLHIAWRHAARFTSARSVVWSHDLQTNGAEAYQNYDQIMGLSGFHVDLLQVNQGIPKDKILLTRNGIDPDRFIGKPRHKEFGKVIFSSSPDRGLDHTIRILEEVRKSGLPVQLHAFYGFDNMIKYGHQAKVDHLKALMKGKDWIKFIGNVPQSKLTDEFLSSQVWLYPADFIETYCITAIESLCSGVYPIVRKLGALPYTLGKASKNNMCDIHDSDMEEKDYQVYAKSVIEAIEFRKYDDVNVDPREYSWESVAREWIEMFDL